MVGCTSSVCGSICSTSRTEALEQNVPRVHTWVANFPRLRDQHDQRFFFQFDFLKSVIESHHWLAMSPADIETFFSGDSDLTAIKLLISKIPLLSDPAAQTLLFCLNNEQFIKALKNVGLSRLGIITTAVLTRMDEKKKKSLFFRLINLINLNSGSKNHVEMIYMRCLLKYELEDIITFIQNNDLKQYNELPNVILHIAFEKIIDSSALYGYEIRLKAVLTHLKSLFSIFKEVNVHDPLESQKKEKVLYLLNLIVTNNKIDDDFKAAIVRRLAYYFDYSHWKWFLESDNAELKRIILWQCASPKEALKQDHDIQKILNETFNSIDQLRRHLKIFAEQKDYIGAIGGFDSNLLVKYVDWFKEFEKKNFLVNLPQTEENVRFLYYVLGDYGHILSTLNAIKKCLTQFCNKYTDFQQVEMLRLSKLEHQMEIGKLAALKLVVRDYKDRYRERLDQILKQSINNLKIIDSSLAVLKTYYNQAVKSEQYLLFNSNSEYIKYLFEFPHRERQFLRILKGCDMSHFENSFEKCIKIIECILSSNSLSFDLQLKYLKYVFEVISTPLLSLSENQYNVNFSVLLGKFRSFDVSLFEALLTMEMGEDAIILVSKIIFSRENINYNLNYIICQLVKRYEWVLKESGDPSSIRKTLAIVLNVYIDYCSIVYFMQKTEKIAFLDPEFVKDFFRYYLKDRLSVDKYDLMINAFSTLPHSTFYLKFYAEYFLQELSEIEKILTEQEREKNECELADLTVKIQELWKIWNGGPICKPIPALFHPVQLLVNKIKEFETEVEKALSGNCFTELYLSDQRDWEETEIEAREHLCEIWKRGCITEAEHELKDLQSRFSSFYSDQPYTNYLEALKIWPISQILFQDHYEVTLDREIKIGTGMLHRLRKLGVECPLGSSIGNALTMDLKPVSYQDCIEEYDENEAITILGEDFLLSLKDIRGLNADKGPMMDFLMLRDGHGLKSAQNLADLGINILRQRCLYRIRETISQYIKNYCKSERREYYLNWFRECFKKKTYTSGKLTHGDIFVRCNPGLVIRLHDFSDIPLDNLMALFSSDDLLEGKVVNFFPEENICSLILRFLFLYHNYDVLHCLKRHVCR